MINTCSPNKGLLHTDGFFKTACFINTLFVSYLHIPEKSVVQLGENIKQRSH
jgi:hypothetical protein